MSTEATTSRALFSHMGLSCLDIDRMTDFYTQVMRMKISDAGEKLSDTSVRLVFLTSDPTEHHQLVLASGRTETKIATTPVLGGAAGETLFQVSFRLPNLAALRETVERLTAFCQPPLVPLNHGNAWAVYSRDVEGNPIELFVDTPWYVPQPAGWPLDLSLSDEEIESATETWARAQDRFQDREDWEAKTAADLEELGHT